MEHIEGLLIVFCFLVLLPTFLLVLFWIEDKNKHKRIREVEKVERRIVFWR